MSRQRSITPAVAAVARHLDVPLVGDVGQAVVGRARHIVASWVAALGPVSSLPELLELVSAKLCLHFEIVADDSDISAITRKYLKEKELAFATLEDEFAKATDAVVFRLQRAPDWSDRKYVAVVDGRGSKKYRVWFSKWHEVAHLIAEPPQRSFVFRRTEVTKRDPLERLMDQIGGALAFYEPLFLPVLLGAGFEPGSPRLRTLAMLRDQHFEFASLQSFVNAALQHITIPAILVEARRKFSKAEQQQIEVDQVDLFFVDADSIEEKVRAVTTSHNAAALDSKFFIHRNMRVPKDSVIWRVFNGSAMEHFSVCEERLSWWQSAGKRLRDVPLSVEATSAGDARVLALVTAASEPAPRSRRPQR